MKKFNFVEKMFKELMLLKEMGLLSEWSIENRKIHYKGEFEGVEYSGVVNDNEYWKIVKNINEAIKEG